MSLKSSVQHVLVFISVVLILSCDWLFSTYWLFVKSVNVDFFLTTTWQPWPCLPSYPLTV